MFETGSGQQSVHPAIKSAGPCGGIYLLPQFHLAEEELTEELTEEPGAPTTTDSVVKTAAVSGESSLWTRFAEQE